MSTEVKKRNRLAPWYIGLVIVLAAIGYVGYSFVAKACLAPASIEFIVLAVVPAVYLTLMYLTLRSQE